MPSPGTVYGLLARHTFNGKKRPMMCPLNELQLTSAQRRQSQRYQPLLTLLVSSAGRCSFTFDSATVSFRTLTVRCRGRRHHLAENRRATAALWVTCALRHPHYASSACATLRSSA